MIAPARTGRERSSRKAVKKTDQVNSLLISHLVNLFLFMLNAVEIKLIAPRIEEAPARCREKMAISTEGPAWAKLPDKGGYTVQPVPTPLSTILLSKRRVRDGGKNQNLRLFIRGYAISGAPIIRGTNQLPKPPIRAGITMKKIITKAWAVTITL